MADTVRRSPDARPSPSDRHLTATSWRSQGGQQALLPDRRLGTAIRSIPYNRGQPADMRPRGDTGQPGVVAHFACDADVDSPAATEWLKGVLLRAIDRSGAGPAEHAFTVPVHVPPSALNALPPGSPPPPERRVTAVVHLASWPQVELALAQVKQDLRDFPAASCGRLDVFREQRNSTLVLKNLPFALRHDHLLIALTQLGVRPCYTRYYHDERGMFKGIAFIKYLCRAAAERGKFQIEQLEVAGRRVRVEFKNKSPAGNRGSGQSRGSPYAPPASSPPNHSAQPSPSLSSSSTTPPQPFLGLAGNRHHDGPSQQQQQQQEAAEEAFRAEWDAKLKELARNPAEDAVLTIPKKGLTFAREQLVRDLCSRHGVRFDSQGSTREAVCVRTQASYAAIYGHQTPPQPATIVGAKVLREGGSAVGTPQSSPGISPAFHPTDRAVLRQAHGVAVVHARGPFDAVPFPQGRGRPLHKQPSPPQRPADICDERA